MDVFPQDLGRRWHTELVRTNIRYSNWARQLPEPLPDTPPAKKSLGWVDRFWSGGGDMDAAARCEGLAALAYQTNHLKIVGGAGGIFALIPAAAMAFQGEIGGAAAMTATAAFFSSVGLMIPRNLFAKAHTTPVSHYQIRELRVNGESLKDDYKSLVVAVMQLSPEIVPVEAQRQIRAALRSLGQALDEIPPAPPWGSGMVRTYEADQLRLQATELTAEAQKETDAVTAASLERQADTLLSSADSLADSLSRAATLARRTQALRGEVKAQIQAFKVGLSNFHTGATEVAGLSDLAEAVRNVTGEAGQIARAQAELDAKPAVLRAGITGGGTT